MLLLVCKQGDLHILKKGTFNFASECYPQCFFGFDTQFNECLYLLIYVN